MLWHIDKPLTENSSELGTVKRPTETLLAPEPVLFIIKHALTGRV